eukprot:599214_1
MKHLIHMMVSLRIFDQWTLILIQTFSNDVISEVYNVLQLSLDDEKETEICLHFIKYFSDLIGKLNDDIEAGIEMISRYRQYALDNEDNAQLVLQANANIKQTLELMNKQNFVLMYQARTYFVHFLNTEYKQFDWYFEKVQQLYKVIKSVIYRHVQYLDKRSKMYIDIHDTVSINLTRYKCAWCGILVKYIGDQHSKTKLHQTFGHPKE